MRRDAVGYWMAFTICAIAATLPLLVTGTLPMADLPEHMAQIAIWKHFRDPCHRFGEVFEIRLATPYLLGSALTVAISALTTVSAAVKLTVWLTVLLLPLSLRSLLRRGDGDPWLSLLGFPLAYGYAFYWGFLNFALAIPIGIFFIALVIDQRPRLLARTALALLLMGAHALMFAFCAAVTVVIAAVRRAPRLLLPLIPAAGLFAAFAFRLREGEQPARAGLFTWKLGAMRLTDFSSVLFANAWEPAGLLLIAGMSVAIAVARPRLTRDAARWSLFGVATLLYLFAPHGALGTAFLSPRFAVLVAVGALLLFDGAASASTRARTFSRVLVLCIVLVWMAVLTSRFRAFAAEAGEIEQILARMPPNRRVAQFNVMPFSEHVPGPVFWHFGALYQVRRGGMAAWSFARHYPTVIRFRPGAEPVIASESTPLEGIDWPGVLQYDYLLVRGPDARRHLFREAPVPITLLARSGAWWLYETPRARGPQRECAPLSE